MKKLLCILAAVVFVAAWSAGAFADQLVINGSFPDGRVGIPYLADHLYLTGYPVDTLSGYAQGFYVWQVIDGEVPAGLEFRTAQLYENGVSYSDWEGRLKASLYGTPTQAGTYTFTVYVYDGGGGSANQAEKTFTVTITGSSTDTNTDTSTQQPDNNAQTNQQTSTQTNTNTGNSGNTNNTDTTGNTSTQTNTTSQNTGSSGGGGGGCNTDIPLLGLLAAAFIFRKSA